MARNPKAPRGKLVVVLSAEPNYDFGPGSWEAEVNLRPEYKVVRSLRDASRATQQYIAQNDLGGGNWTGGAVYDDQGQQVARISYNGRVWEPGPWQRAKEIKVGASRVARAWMRRMAGVPGGGMPDWVKLQDELAAAGIEVPAEKWYETKIKEAVKRSKFVFRSKAMEALWPEISGQITDGIWGGPGGGWWRLYWGWIPTTTGSRTQVQGTAPSSVKVPPGFVDKLMKYRADSLLKAAQVHDPSLTEEDLRIMLEEIRGAMKAVKAEPIRAPAPTKGKAPRSDIEKIEHELRWKFGLQKADMVFSKILVGRYGQRANQYHFFAIYKDKESGEFVGGNAYGTFGKAPRSVELARDADIKKVQRKVDSKIRKKLQKYEESAALLPRAWASTRYYSQRQAAERWDVVVGFDGYETEEMERVIVEEMWDEYWPGEGYAEDFAREAGEVLLKQLRPLRLKLKMQVTKDRIVGELMGIRTVDDLLKLGRILEKITDSYGEWDDPTEVVVFRNFYAYDKSTRKSVDLEDWAKVFGS